MPKPFMVVAGVFVALHGLVHLLYVGQSHRLFELQPEFDWPAGSWAFSRLLGEDGTAWLASITFAAVALAFQAAGVGILARQPWWRAVTVGASALSGGMVLLLWNGRLERLDDQGLVGLLIDLGILAAGLAVQWPSP